MSSAVQVGIELDGTRATVVSVHEGTVASIDTLTAATAEGALSAALASSRPTDPVRVVLLTDGITARRVDVTASSATADGFAELALAATGTPREGTTTAGMIFDRVALASGLLSAGVAAVAPAEPVARLYATLARERSEVVPSIFTSGVMEGLSLAIRHSGADLTLVVDGEPVAYQQLPAGGLAAVATVLGGGTKAGAERLQAALTGRAQHDPIAVGELERYLRNVLSDVTLTLEAWARRGERVTRDLFIHGPGARARALDVLMGDAGLTRTDHPAVTRALVSLDPLERLSAVAAYLAATTLETGGGSVAFPNPRTAQRLLAQSRRRRRARRLRVFAGAALLVAVGAAVPVGVGVGSRVAAEHRLAEAQAGLDALGKDGRAAADYSALQQSRTLLARSGAWGKNVPAITAATPPGVHVQTLDLQADGTTVDVSVAGTATGGVKSVADYMDNLRARVGARELIPGVVTTSGGTATFALTFTLPGAAR